MSDSENETLPVKTTKKPAMAEKGSTEKAAIVHAKPAHPPVANMVNDAIRTLDEKKGSSVRAIKNYIEANYTVEMNRVLPFIKRHLKRGVEDGSIIQKSGMGATGSFKLAPIKKSAKKKETKKASEDPEEEQTKPKRVVGPKSKKKEAAMKKTKPTKQKSQDEETEEAESDNEEVAEEVVPKKKTKAAAAAEDKPLKKPTEKKMAKKETKPTEKKKAPSRKAADKGADDDGGEKLTPKSPSMAKKGARSPVAKPRAPKPKKLTAPKK